MNLIKSLALGALGLVLSVTPSFARVESGTYELLETLEEGGINIVYRTAACDGTIYGRYEWIGLKRQLVLCPGHTVDAVDHRTVRHETAHSIQHCMNVALNRPMNTPVLELDKLAEIVNSVLSQETVRSIKAYYPEDEWAVEFEANVVAEIYTADELIDIFNEACTLK